MQASSETQRRSPECFRCLSSGMMMGTGCIMLENPWPAGVLAVSFVDPSPPSNVLVSDVLVMQFVVKEAECWAHGRLPCE